MGEAMRPAPSNAARPGSGDTLLVSVHGPLGVLDLVVPAQATALDLSRQYASEAGLGSLPLLQTPLGVVVPAGSSLASAGVESGDVLVAVTGLHRPRRTTLAEAARSASDTPSLASLIAGLAVAVAVLAGWYGARTGDADPLRTLTVGVLAACAVTACLPWGRHHAQRSAAAPAFAGAAAFAAFWQSGDHLLPAVLATSALAAAIVAAVGRMLSPEPHASSTVWLVCAGIVALLTALSPLLGWDGRVSWALLLLVAMMAARFAPSLAVDVPDEALLDLDRLAVTAWSARDSQRRGRRGRLVVAGEAMGDLVRTATRLVTGAAVAIAVVTAVAAPLLLDAAVLDLDRIGARCLVLFAGCSILLAARSYRLRAARVLLRIAGLAALAALAVHLVPSVDRGAVVGVVVAGALLGMVALAAAIAAGRGWRSVWWSRRAEVAESFCGSFAFAATVVAVGLFRHLWEITS
jgi:hypothetical protein